MKGNMLDIFRKNKKLNQSASFEDRLVALMRLGKPRVHCMDGGKWHVCVNMSVFVSGVNFEIASDFDLATPSLAMDQLEKRVEEALDKMRGQQ